MARMYEMNLIIRLQDRASARMRRISGDMSTMARHAQAQNKYMSARNNLGKEYQRLANTTLALEDRTVKTGVKRNQILAETKRLQRDLSIAQDRLNKSAISAGQQRKWFDDRTTETQRSRMKLTERQRRLLYNIDVLMARQRAHVSGVVQEEQNLLRAREASIAAIHAQNAEIARTAPLIAAQEKQVAKYRAGRAIAHGGSLSFMGGAVAVGLSGLAAGAYARFNVQARKAATQVGDTNLSISESIEQTMKIAKDQEKVLLNLARQFPATAEEQAKAQYDIFSSMDLGSNAIERQKKGLDVLTAANKVAVGAQTDLATATNTLITVFNDFDPNIQNIDKNMAELFAIVRFMRGGFDELSAGMNKLAPAAKLANYSLLDMGAAFAVITQAIPSAAQSSTALARLVDAFSRKEFVRGMEKLGKEFKVVNEQGRLLPFDQIIGKILKFDASLANGGTRLTNFMKEITQSGSESGRGGYQGTIQMTRALAVLLTEHDKHLRILKQAREDTVEYEKSVKLLSETADVKWKIAMNKLRVAWIQFGEAVMPILLGILDLFTKAADKFNSLGGTTRKVLGTIIVLLGLVAVAGGAAASAIGGIMMIRAAVQLQNIERALILGEAAAGRFNGKLKLMTGLLRGLGAIAAVVITFKILLEWKTRNQTFTSLDEAIMGSIEGLKDKIPGGKLNPLYWVTAATFAPVEGVVALDKWQREAATRQEKARNAQAAAEKAAAEESEGIYDKLTKASKNNLDAILAAEQAQIDAKKELISWEKRYAKEVVRARQAAEKQRKQDVDNAAKFLLSKYRELDAANKAATGSLLNGPLSGGPILGAFQNINQTLMGLGVKPIKIPLEFLMKDAQGSLANFDAWRGGLKKLGKRLPKEMLNELQAGGIEKLPEILSLADASPQFLKGYIDVWEKTKAARKAATDADFAETLKDWNKYGNDVAWQIVNGLIDSGAEAKLYEGFSSLVTTTFAGQLTKSMNDAMNEAIQNWLEANPKPVVPKGPTQIQVDRTTRAFVAEDYAANLIELGYATNNPNLNRARYEEIRRSKYGPLGPQGPLRRAMGGVIPGSGSGDTVPAMLTPGELVLNKRQIRNAAGMLGTSNNPHSVFNKVQHFANGGVVAVNNYSKMKNVSFVKDPQSGIISVINKAGVRYRKFAPGQSGYLEASMIAQFPGQSVTSEIGGLLHSLTLSGIKEQFGAMYQSFRHPIRRLKSGGQMVLPGRKPGKSLRDLIKEQEQVKPIAKAIGETRKVEAGGIDRAELAARKERLAREKARLYGIPVEDAVAQQETKFIPKTPAQIIKERAERAAADKVIIEQKRQAVRDARLKAMPQYQKNAKTNLSKAIVETRSYVNYVSKMLEENIILREAGYTDVADGQLFKMQMSLEKRLGSVGRAIRWINKSRILAEHIANDTGLPKGFRGMQQPISQFQPISPRGQAARGRLKKAAKASGSNATSAANKARRKEIRDQIAKLQEELSRLMTDETGTLDLSGFGRRKGTNNLPKQDLFSEISRVEAKKMLEKLTEASKQRAEAEALRRKKQGYRNGGWVRGTGNSDTVPAYLTPGEFVLSKPMIKDLTKNGSTSGGQTTIINNTHNYNGVDEKSISAAFKQQEFRLRHKGK